MAATTLSATGRRFLSTAAEAKLPVPIAVLRWFARNDRLANIDAVLAPLLPTRTVTVLSILSSLGLHRRASYLLSAVASPTAAHLNAVLGPLLLRRKMARLVPSILAAHPSVPRDASTDSILAKSLCLTSGTDSALHLLQAPPSGAPPSVQLFTTLIDSFYKQRLPDRAEELWRAMVQNHGIAPDAAAYNTRIIYKSANGTVDEVQELIRVMREDAGLAPDVVSYNALIRAMAWHKRVDEAIDIYSSLKAGEVKGVSPNCATYTSVVAALCAAERWSEAEDVFYEGVKRRSVIDLGTLRMLVLGLKGAGKGSTATRLLGDLHKMFPEHEFDGPWREDPPSGQGGRRL